MRICKLKSDSAGQPGVRIFQTPKRGKYLVHNPWANLLLRTVDKCLGFCFPPRIPHDQISPPQKILLVNGAHLGDVLLSTVVIPVLKQAFPHAKIGFLVGSWAKVVVERNSDVNWIHLVDHWKLNRSEVSTLSKFVHYLKTKRSALKEVKGISYDIAIDLYPYFPNMVPLLWRAKVPVRIAYDSGGFGPLLTHSLVWKNKDQSVAEYHAGLLRRLPIAANSLNNLGYDVKSSLIENRFEPDLESSFSDFACNEYIVFHPGTGSRSKEWPLGNWISLANELSGMGYNIVFTGSGSREFGNIDDISKGLANTYNLCDELDWWEFGRVVSHAVLVVCLDSAAGHVAAATGVPCVVLSTGMANPHHWVPIGDNVVLLTSGTHCSPCYRSRGCPEMPCIREVKPDVVLKEVLSLLRELGDGVA